LAREKRLDFRCDIESNVPSYAFGDFYRIRQIIVNVVGNAIKFTERGRVEVEVALKEYDAVDMRLLFIIRDTGVGMAQDKQGLIFEAFSQADSSTSRKFGGSGLGLTISSRLAQAMGGKIWMESALGKGSSFHFEVCLGVVAKTSPTHAEEICS
jgi:two-component system sensor histidine kinase/response regulator